MQQDLSDGFQSAEKMFWKTPELVDKLIHFLNAESVSRLAEVHQLTAEVLQGTSTWDKLVKRSCPSSRAGILDSVVAIEILKAGGRCHC